MSVSNERCHNIHVVLARRAYSHHITGKNKSCFLSIHVRTCTCIARKVAMETPAQA